MNALAYVGCVVVSQPPQLSKRGRKRHSLHPDSSSTSAFAFADLVTGDYIRNVYAGLYVRVMLWLLCPQHLIALSVPAAVSIAPPDDAC